MINLTEKNEAKSKGKSLVASLSDYTVLDIETTGLSPQNNEIIELAAIKIRNNEIVDTYSSLIKPQNEISPFITNLTNITNEMVQSAPSIDTEIINFLNFVGDDIIIGHNVSFDINFINANSLKVLNIPFSNDYVDTLRLSRMYVASDSHKLGIMASKFNIDYSGAHRALKDCHITFKLYAILKNSVEIEKCKTKQLL